MYIYTQVQCVLLIVFNKKKLGILPFLSFHMVSEPREKKNLIISGLSVNQFWETFQWPCFIPIILSIS